jgi:hypothetical protein
LTVRAVQVHKPERHSSPSHQAVGRDNMSNSVWTMGRTRGRQ